MRYMQHMKTRLLLSFTLLACLGACDKAETSKTESTAAESTAAESIAAETTNADPAKAESAAKVAASVDPKAATATAAAEAEASCAGADGEKHGGADCMKKSAEQGEGGGCNQWDEAAAEIAKKEVPTDAQWQVLKVEGMTCGGCERRIIANVGALDGVVAVEADSELGQVRVAIASGNTKAGKAAASKIGELGFKIQ